MFEKPNVWIASLILGLFSGLVVGMAVYLMGYREYWLSGFLAFLIVTTGILSFTYANEIYTHIVWHRSERASARKDRARAVAMEQYWAEWEGAVPAKGDEPEVSEEGLVVLNRHIPINGGQQGSFTAQQAISVNEWDRRIKAIEFFRWAYVLRSVTAPSMVRKAVDNATDWTAITTILAAAGLLTKNGNGKATEMAMEPLKAIELIETGRVALEGRLPKVNECPVELFAAVPTPPLQ